MTENNCKMTKREAIKNEEFDAWLKEVREVSKAKMRTYYEIQRRTDFGKTPPQAKSASQILNYINLEVKCLQKSIDEMESNKEEWINICGTKKGYEMYLSNQKARCASLGSVLFYAKYGEVNYSDKL